MSEYIVSARKYRPDSFETLIGQDNIARTLKNSILRGQLAHAYPNYLSKEKYTCDT